MIPKPLKKLMKKIGGFSSKRDKPKEGVLQANSLNGATSAETTASMMEALQREILQEEAVPWDHMELNFSDCCTSFEVEDEAQEEGQK